MLEGIDLAIAVALVPYGLGCVAAALRVIDRDLAVRRGEPVPPFFDGLVEIFGWPVDLWRWWRSS